MANNEQSEKLHRYYEKKQDNYRKIMDRREAFLEKNDARLERIRERNDNALQVMRVRNDERLEQRRQRIEEKYIGGDLKKEQRFEKLTQNTDRRIEKIRGRRDRQAEKRREALRKKRAANEARVQKAYAESRIRDANREKRDLSYLEQGKINPRLKYALIGLAAIIAVFVLTQAVMPNGLIRRHFGRDAAGEAGAYSAVEFIPDEQPAEAAPAQVITKEYDTLDGITEEQNLWDVLMEYFGGNKTAVLGVMCNLNAESRFKASSLEDYNNQMWGIDDEYYTMRVNKRTIERRDFAESRWDGISTGYFNAYKEWVNRDGGYGYAQVTAYDKKDDLYKFADYWFSPGGQGEDYLFNIADPKMQAYFLISILESEQYSHMNYMIRHAQNVVDACYYWLKFYEIPYDPYADNYYTLSFDRAAAADEIEWRCTEERDGTPADADSDTETEDTEAESTDTENTEAEGTSESEAGGSETAGQE
ncbi:MAG: hypothetical protein J6P87_06130 [Lachnospiraceae bacterium]|nr:hypothetical protein [Lachnospiraceae bacterium]